MATATDRQNWKDSVSGGKQGTQPDLMRKRFLPDYGPLSPRIVHPKGKYLFTAGDEPPARIGRGRKMTQNDFQVVTLYSDLSRRDIGYLQSIARVYDVTQMRELIQFRLHHMGKKKRCLDVTRHEDYEVYRGYLEKKYGGRMPDLMPLMRDQSRPAKPWPRVNEYPTARDQQKQRESMRRDTYRMSRKIPALDQSKLKDSVVAVRGSEVEEEDPTGKTSIRKGKAAEKPGQLEQKHVAGKAARKSEPGVPGGASAPSTKRSSKPTQRKKSQGEATGASSHEDTKAKKGPASDGDTAKKVIPGKVVSRVKEDESVDFVDMFLSQSDKELDTTKRADKGGSPAKTSTPGDSEDAENRYAEEKFEQPTEDVTPELAMSMSFDDLKGIFTPEYDDGRTTGSDKGQKQLLKDDFPLFQEEDVDDKPTENVRGDEPAEQMDEETVKRLEKSASQMAPVYLFDDDLTAEDEKIQVFPREASPFTEHEVLEYEELYKSSVDDELSKTQFSAREGTVPAEAGGSSNVDDQRKQTTTPETRDLTTSGDEEDYESIHEVPSCVVDNPPL